MTIDVKDAPGEIIGILLLDIKIVFFVIELFFAKNIWELEFSNSDLSNLPKNDL